MSKPYLKPSGMCAYLLHKPASCRAFSQLSAIYGVRALFALSSTAESSAVRDIAAAGTEVTVVVGACRATGGALPVEAKGVVAFSRDEVAACCAFGEGVMFPVPSLKRLATPHVVSGKASEADRADGWDPFTRAAGKTPPFPVFEASAASLIALGGGGAASPCSIASVLAVASSVSSSAAAPLSVPVAVTSPLILVVVLSRGRLRA